MILAEEINWPFAAAMTGMMFAMAWIVVTLIKEKP